MATLGIDPGRLLLMIINFVILMFLLQRVLFKPMFRVMDERAKRIADSLAEADRVRAEAQQQNVANQAALDEARKQAADLLAAATQTANQIREQATALAHQEAERLLERARSEIALERDQAIADVRKQAVDLAIMAAGKVIGQTLTGPDHYRIVNEFMQSAEAGKN